MAARKFFYVCAGLFLLALSYNLGARTAGATAPIAQSSEVAVLSGVLHNGATIPLPIYADGTTALESECAWTVSPAYYTGSSNFCYTANAMYGYPGPYVEVDNTAFYAAHPGRVVNAGGGGAPWPLDANYVIIATRGASLPTATHQQGWGQLKARYAPKSSPVLQTPTDR